jgi:ribose-phosphate pyrophosphokinase
VITESVRGKTVYILQSGSHNAEDPETGRQLSVNDMIMETLLIADAVTRSGCKNIILLCPCYPYARQDKKDKARAAISAKCVADLFEAKGIKRIVATELHNPCIQGFFGKSVDNLYTMDLIIEWLRENEFPLLSGKDDYVVISPDEGGFKRGSVFADKLGLPFLAMSKQRDYSQKNVVSKNVLLGDSDALKGKTAIILDDMLDTGGTAIQTIWLLVELGAKDVIICVTHGVLSGNAVERIEGCERLKYLLMSDSLSFPCHANFAKAKGKLRVFTLAKLYSDVVQRLVEGRSISEIFE